MNGMEGIIDWPKAKTAKAKTQAQRDTGLDRESDKARLEAPDAVRRAMGETTTCEALAAWCEGQADSENDEIKRLYADPTQPESVSKVVCAGARRCMYMVVAARCRAEVREETK